MMNYHMAVKMSELVINNGVDGVSGMMLDKTRESMADM